jgi:hypothetical protein
MYRYLLTGVICLLAGGVYGQGANDAASAPAPAKPVISMEEPIPGDFWTYELRDEISGSVKAVRNNLVTEVTATEISVRFNIQGKPEEGLNVYDRSWNLKGAAPWKYTPHDGSGIQLPLKAGASWKSDADDVNASNGNIWKRASRSTRIPATCAMPSARSAAPSTRASVDATKLATLGGARATPGPLATSSAVAIFNSSRRRF